MQTVIRPNTVRAIVCLFLLLLTSAVKAQELLELWSLSNVFNMPESATYDAKRDQIFVSNVNSYAKDGNGFVSRVSADGKQIELKWLTGLDSPTGLLAVNDILYIVDYDSLVIADIDTQRILKRIPVSDAKPALNDVTRSPSGQIFVTGSASRSIYVLAQGKLEVWKHDKQRLKQANGLFAQDQQLVHGGLFWSVFDLQSKQLVDDFVAPGQPISDIDGITTHPCGGYIVSLIDDDKLWHIRADGSSHPLSEQSINGIDLQRVGNRLFVPVVGGGLRVFQIQQLNCGQPGSPA